MTDNSASQDAVVIERNFDAPVDLIWKMWTDPEHGPMQMWFAGEYHEVVENQRLVYTEYMSDEHGNASPPAGMPEGHPMTTEVRVELEDVGGRTKMVMTHAGIPTGSPGAAGWTVALDKLLAHVEAQSRR